jgi:hypothetical protein
VEKVEQVEISSLDLRYESYRMRHEGAEKALLCSISDCGIRDPLEGIDTRIDTEGGTEDKRILLNGFKRLRCARKLGIGMVPYCSLGTDEAMGIIHLIRISNAKSLTILEQARLIDDLRQVHKMSLLEIAQSLERSKGWVSMRLGIIEKMSEGVMEKLFKGEFPVYSYMYTLRQFIRMNSNSSPSQNSEVDEFVNLTAGKNLSIRDIERLAHGYFNGPDHFREQIKRGHIVWALEQLHKMPQAGGNLSEPECGMLKCLEIVQKYMRKVIYQGKDERFKNNTFFAQANLLAGGILSKLPAFSKSLKEFYDRSGQA